jgi:hypothetical protein
VPLFSPPSGVDLSRMLVAYSGITCAT